MTNPKSFIVKESKFDFFFGRVTSSTSNQARSLQNLRELELLGIREQDGGREQLMQIFREGLSAPERLPRREDRYGVTIRRIVQIENDLIGGELEIFYLYRNGDLSSLPEVTSLIPRIYGQKNDATDK